jgi:hypothetical protein
VTYYFCLSVHNTGAFKYEDTYIRVLEQLSDYYRYKTLINLTVSKSTKTFFFYPTTNEYLHKAEQNYSWGILKTLGTIGILIRYQNLEWSTQ